MHPKRTSTSEAPAMTQAAIRKLVADSVVAALEAQATTMARAVGLIRWFKRTESVFATSTLTNDAFELAVLCPNMVPNTEKLMEVFIGGLPRSIEGNVTASKPQTLEEAITITQRLMDQFRVGIGMDWLSKYHAIVHILINGETLIIRVFIAQVIEKKSDEKRLEDIPVVREFLEVFPEDLDGLPPVCQVEFQIDLIPGPAPVAGAPYRSAPSEMQEQSNQLQELADRDLMNRVCKPYLDKFVIVFIDDILIYSRNKEEYVDYLRIILELLINEKLYANFSKCDFWISIVQYLGHLIDSQGLHVDPAKIEAIAKSLTELTQKNKKYIWGKDQESAFQLLKQKLCEAPILALLEGNDDFVVYYNASLQGLGAVLMQREKHILDQKELNMKQRRWLELLADYDCEIRYHPGNANVMADALSQIKPLQVRSLVMTIHLKFPSQILQAQNEALKEETLKAENL
ncbi:putative reverse transcriptase domain-containing protein [Tanacetum coccineum]